MVTWSDIGAHYAQALGALDARYWTPKEQMQQQRQMQQQTAQQHALQVALSAATAASSVPVPEAADTSAARALLDYLRPLVGMLSWSYVAELHLPSLLADAAPMVGGVPTKRLSLLSDVNLAVVRMQNGMIGAVMLDEAIVNVAIAQKTAEELTK